MDYETKLAELMRQVDQNAVELDRTIAAMSELRDFDVAFSREALVDGLGFDATIQPATSLPNCALRA